MDTKPLTNAELDAIAKTERKATAGPWNTRAPMPEVRAPDDGVPIVNWQGFDDSDRPSDEHRANAHLIAALRNNALAIIAQAREANRLREGKFTPDELQNLCHNLTDADATAFCNGCSEYQRKLFGKSERDEAQAEVRVLRYLLREASMALHSQLSDERMRTAIKDIDAALATSAPATDAPAPQALPETVGPLHKSLLEKLAAAGWRIYPDNPNGSPSRGPCGSPPGSHHCLEDIHSLALDTCIAYVASLDEKRAAECVSAFKPMADAAQAVLDKRSPQALPWRKVAEGMPAKDDCVVWQMAYVDAFAFGWLDGDKVRFDDGEALAVERFTHWLPLTPPADAGADAAPSAAGEVG